MCNSTSFRRDHNLELSACTRADYLLTGRMSLFGGYRSAQRIKEMNEAKIIKEKKEVETAKEKQTNGSDHDKPLNLETLGRDCLTNIAEAVSLLLEAVPD